MISCSVVQAFYFPIDPRLNFFVANKLLKELAVSDFEIRGVRVLAGCYGFFFLSTLFCSHVAW